MRKRFLQSIALLLGIANLSCQVPASEPVLFKKIPSTYTNVSFNNTIQPNDSLNILDYLYYYNGGGVAAGDVNNDGKTDLYFVSNRGANKLYLNEGGMKFKDVTSQAGVAGKSNWKTGVTMVDINADGWLDIYVNVVGNYKGLVGNNELYINNHDGTFTESASEYGLDFKGFATQSAFFDYDKDGDLDCYILTHAVHSVSSYDRVSARALRDGEAGDYLMRNDKSKFVDVSSQSGIYGAAMGYGLGIVTADINNDGWEDIYVANDFHEDDYYYINQRDGTFKEAVKEHFMHLSKYSMGCDVADVNNDGYLDVFTTDMHPQDETVEKLSLGEDAYDIYLYKLQFGFYNQYSRNCLQINNKGRGFSDISMMAGVSSTDWSWSPLIADFDNDGVKDLFVSNGIPHRPNNLDYIKYLSAETDSTVLHSIPVFGQKVKDQKAIGKMPDGKAHNYLYKGIDGWRFEDKSLAWGMEDLTISNGAIYADLDNDGDLDIVTNDLDAPAGIYQNQSEKFEQKPNYLRIKLEGEGGNRQGIGTKVFAKVGNTLQHLQQQPTRGFMSSNDPVLHLGLGDKPQIDQLVVIWPDGKMEIKEKVKANQVLVCKQADAKLDGSSYRFDQSPLPLLVELPNVLKEPHVENDFIDFIREPLIPFLASSEGPKLAVGDVNNDGLEDLYQGGSRNKKRYLLLQQPDGTFAPSVQTALLADSVCEDTDAVFLDVDKDKDLDLYVVSGGNEYFENMIEIRDRLYLNDGKGNFTKKADVLPEAVYHNKSCVRPCDVDADGDLDLFVGGGSVSSNYGELPHSHLLINDGTGKFKDQTPEDLRRIGMVTNAAWGDLDQDGQPDLVVVGEWMGIRTFLNNKGKLRSADNGLEQYVGFWHGLSLGDVDNDGDLDMIVGNLGTNTKFIRQAKPTMRMYTNDMDGNGVMEQILAYQQDGKWYPAASRDDLSRMAPGLINRRFPKYSDYAGKTIDKLFTKEELNGKNAKMYEVNTFESVWIENKGEGAFEVKPLPREVQVSKVFAIQQVDIDGDKRPEILLGGNLYGVSTYQGRYDASYGHVLKYGTNGLTNVDGTGFWVKGQIRDIKLLQTPQGNRIIVGRNNQTPMLFGRNKPSS